MGDMIVKWPIIHHQMAQLTVREAPKSVRRTWARPNGHHLHSLFFHPSIEKLLKKNSVKVFELATLQGDLEKNGKSLLMRIKLSTMKRLLVKKLITTRLWKSPETVRKRKTKIPMRKSPSLIRARRIKKTTIR